MFKLNKCYRLIAWSVFGISLATVVAPTPSTAANNVKSNIVTVGQNGEQALDLTLNTDWDFDASVTQIGTGGTSGRTARILDRGYLTDLIKQTARTLYVMTNGRHTIGKVYVYKNGKFGNNVDIRVINTVGRANASVSGWKTEGGFTTNNYITNCTSSSGCPAGTDASNLDPESPGQTGEVIAHELGHYVYGLLDEYAEAGKACESRANQAGSPCQSDIVKPTAMNDQSKSYRLSIASDYTGTENFRTAHSRAYAKDDGSRSSAWEMLTSDPANDGEIAKGEHGGRRVQFDAFKNYATPSSIAALKTFTAASEDETPDQRLARQLGPDAAVFSGYDANLQIIFEGDPNANVAQTPEPRNVLLIDRTLPSSTFAEVIKAAEGLVDRAPANAKFALVTSPSTSSQNFASMSPSNKATLRASLASLTNDTGGTFDFASAYTAAKSFVTAARPTTGTENAGNTDTISVFTVNTRSVSASSGDTARADKIAVNVIGFKVPVAVAVVTPSVPMTKPAPVNSLEMLTKSSGGVNNTSSTAKEAIKESAKALGESMGESEVTMSTSVSDDSIAANRNFDHEFIVGPGEVDGPVEVRWYFDKADQNKLTFQCLGPNGNSASTSITDLGGEDAMASCVIAQSLASRIGTWTARATASSATGDAVEVEVVSTLAGTPVEATVTIDGGSVVDKRAPVLFVKFAGQFPIINASITVDLFDANSTSTTPVKSFTLTKANDAGTNGDARANDGIYTLPLSGLLNAGDYVAVIEAKTDNTSMFNPVQRFVVGVAPSATSVGGVISREAESEFSLEQGATGVGIAAATGGGGGGGCTTGNGSDSGLIILLGIATLALLRKRFKLTDRA